MKPKITVLLAVYNGQAYLRECMDSVLNQTYKDFEFLIVDDGSTDATRDIIKSYSDDRIRLIENGRNLSQVTSLNIGLDHAHSEYVARIDADDVMLPHRLKRQLDFLTRRPSIALAGSWGEAIDIKGRMIARGKLPLRRAEIIATVLFGEFISVHSAVMFRREAVLDVGKYNEAFSFTEDYKLITDLLLHGYYVSNMPEVLIRYRFHEDRISVRNSKPQAARCILAIRRFIENLTEGFSESERNLLFDFLINAGSMNKKYWENGLRKEDAKRIIGASDLLLNSVSGYFKLKKNENFFMKKIFYNRILNFAYQGRGLKNASVTALYLWCLRNCLFVLERPKLYLYPFVSYFSYLKRAS